MLLAGLDRVAWNEVSHAYGPATDVPDLLRALANPSEAAPWIVREAEAHRSGVRERVIWLLWGNVFHQGSVWEATPHVIPFLLEILRAGPADLDLRRFLVTYLHHLALGYPQDLFPSTEVPRDEYAQACFDAVESGLPLVLPFASSEDQELAFAAIACAASFPRAATASSEVLRGLLAAEQGDRLERIGVLLVALAQMRDPSAHAEAERRVTAPDEMLAMNAACASALADPGHMSASAVDRLIAPLSRPDAPSPFTETIGTLVSRCLVRLPADHAARAVAAIARNLASAEPMANLAQSGALLRLAFGATRAPHLAAELTPLQRAALEAIVESGAFAVNGVGFANYSLLLRDWGLPSEADALRAWLAGSQMKGPLFSGFRSS